MRLRISFVLLAALLISGCYEQSTQSQSTDGNKEADLSCYWPAEDHASEPAVKKALVDGILTQDECRNIIQPLSDGDYEKARVSARNRAVEASRKASHERNLP